jgi:NAD(P)-dependent dehydrogenase (short-subunit alcohol dehydrogenase family)
MSGSVLVTGASTGIGEATALHMEELGWRVLAGVRKDEDAERLREASKGSLEPVKLDVTDEGSVRAAAGQAGERLDGLVNNAGISIAGPLEFVPVEDFRRQLEVNVIGQVAVTQALLPALRAAKGRIVNVGSIGGLMAVPLASPYAASKFALEGITDSLRRELRAHGVHVAIVEPGGVRTPIWAKGQATADELRSQMPPEVDGLYGELIGAVTAEARRIAEEGMAPKEVAEVIAHALTAKRPRTRYLVGRDAKLRGRMVRVLPDRAVDALVARALSR